MVKYALSHSLKDRLAQEESWEKMSDILKSISDFISKHSKILISYPVIGFVLVMLGAVLFVPQEHFVTIKEDKIISEYISWVFFVFYCYVVMLPIKIVYHIYEYIKSKNNMNLFFDNIPTEGKIVFVMLLDRGFVYAPANYGFLLDCCLNEMAIKSGRNIQYNNCYHITAKAKKYLLKNIDKIYLDDDYIRQELPQEIQRIGLHY